MSSGIAEGSLYSQVSDWSNLLLAYQKAAKGKGGKGALPIMALTEFVWVASIFAALPPDVRKVCDLP
jgi:hypothetical protein